MALFSYSQRPSLWIKVGVLQERKMPPDVLRPSHPKAEWVRRFAYRAMLVQPAIDSMSAVMMADSQFDDACDLEPEDAAEIHAAPPAEGGSDESP